GDDGGPLTGPVGRYASVESTGSASSSRPLAAASAVAARTASSYTAARGCSAAVSAVGGGAPGGGVGGGGSGGGRGRAGGAGGAGGSWSSCVAGVGSWGQLRVVVGVVQQGVGPQAEGGAELVGVQVGDRAAGGEDEVGDAALAGDDLLDLLVDGAGADEAVAD